MKETVFIVYVCFVSCLTEGIAQNIKAGSKELSELDNDFEDGTLQPWIEESQGSVRWKVGNQASSWEPNNPAPQPLNGKNYLRVDRRGSKSFGVAILRSPTFKLPSGNEINVSFAFWIRSKWPAFTNLEVYLARNGNEELLVNLYNYSDISNRSWQSRSLFVTGQSSSTFSLVFYAYCGIDAEDAVAIDDILFSPASQDFTTLAVTESTTNGQTTTADAPACPSSLFNMWHAHDSFVCPNNLDMLHPIPGDACSSQYYECDNCVATLMDCEGNKIYNDEAQDCQPCSQVPKCRDQCKK
ncbi:uncharacterized protein LOC130693538 [Daphnia carinata]|uniref:uncharacterized protein LOC130693538 n=1 Tax=Daphnia carinata TaxID=120202 RepID=UPI002580373C|nr:uncharacterized protein LOC130693538 [Daphnia carinata]